MLLPLEPSRRAPVVIAESAQLAVAGVFGLRRGHSQLGELRKLPPQQEPEWGTINQIRDSWLSIETERNQFLLDLNETMLSKIIHYSDTRWRAVTLELWQAIFQCVNHSTFHRGQLMEKLRKLGKIPPTTDFVLFCRGIDK